MKRKRLLIIFGTRPETIKLAPLIFALKNSGDAFDVVTCVTGQHREMLQPFLRLFDITPDYNLDLMRPKQKLHELVSVCLEKVTPVLDSVRPDMVIVQGDTTTAFASSLCSFYRKIPVAHVEAGLRTVDKYAPYPEEINRRMVTLLADLHFAPTNSNRNNLLREGVSPKNIFVTGNTGIDCLLLALEKTNRNGANCVWSQLRSEGRKIISLTLHRRESFGRGIREILTAVKDIVDEFRDHTVVYPVHLNPNVKSVAEEMLGGHSSVILTPPLDYLDFIHLLRNSSFVMTDSGGVQEEAPSLGKIVFVLRDKTERVEGVAAGVNKLVGTRRQSIVDQVSKYIRSGEADQVLPANPFGDGKASARIVDILKSYLGVC